MIWRVMVGVCGVAVIAAATHLNVLHAGGYRSDGALLITAMAALLTVGLGFVGLLWNERRRGAAVGLALCILAGEVFWVCTNAEREIAQREEQALPAVIALDRRLVAHRRLEVAEAGKRAADAAAVSEAAKPGCKANCAQLLLTAQLTANQELAAARASLAGLHPLPTTDGLPSRLGISPWAWDLWMASLRSVAVIGASLTVGLALHPRTRAAPALTQDVPRTRRVSPTPIADLAKRRAKPEPADAREHVSEFMMECVRPDPLGNASLRDLHARYLPWCATKSKQPLPSPILGRELRKIIETIGLDCEPAHGDVIIHGATISS